MKLILSLILLNSVSWAQFKNPSADVFNDFVQPTINPVSNKIRQLDTNFVSKTIGDKTIYYGPGKKGCLGYDGTNTLKRNTDITYSSQTNGSKVIERLKLNPCRPGAESFTFVLVREGINLKPVKNIVKDLLEFRLKENETSRSFYYYDGTGYEPMRAILQKSGNSIYGSIFAFQKKYITYNRTISSTQDITRLKLFPISVDFDFGFTRSKFNFSIQRQNQYDLQVNFNPTNGSIHYKVFANPVPVSQNEFEAYLANYHHLNQHILIDIMKDHLAILPDTELPKGSAVESQFEKELNKAIVDSSIGNSTEVRKFLERTKLKIDGNKLEIIEN